jgi:hypothetical protein
MLRTVSTGHSNDESTVGISAGLFIIIESVGDLKVLNPTRESVVRHRLFDL